MRTGMFRAAILAAGVVILGGCIAAPLTRTGNQGGSNPLQAVNKVLANRLGELNPDDVQVLSDLVFELAGIDLPPVDDELAAAVISFLRANRVETLEDLRALIRLAEQDPAAIVIPDDVRRVVEALIADLGIYEQVAREAERAER